MILLLKPSESLSSEEHVCCKHFSKLLHAVKQPGNAHSDLKLLLMGSTVNSEQRHVVDNSKHPTGNLKCLFGGTDA